MTASKTWPIRSAGPHRPGLPLSTSLLRIVPGCPRNGEPPVHWFNNPPPSPPYTLDAAYDNASASIVLPDPTLNPIADQWFDFDAHLSHPTAFISFTLTAGSNRYTTHFLFNQFSTRHGVLTAALLDVHNVPVARLTIDFIYITAYSSSQLSSFKRPFIPRFIGHRGMGSSGPNAPWRPRENSVESFLAATLLNPAVTTIELDVQLTRDGKVVVFHDWFFRPLDSDGHPLHDKESIRIAVHNLTYHQLNALYQKSHPVSASLTQQQTDVRRIAQERNIDPKAFAVKVFTLAEVCSLLPPDIGILLEIKYPAPDVQEELGIPYPEKNHYVDLVLADLLQSNTGHSDMERQIAFLSFHPDICMLLSMKQHRFPVYFSHCETLDKPCDEFDPRAIDLREGLRFVKSQGLDGLMIFNELIEHRPEAVADIVAQDVPIITYGKSNKYSTVVMKQFEKGIHGVIADDVDVLMDEMQALTCQQKD